MKDPKNKSQLILIPDMVPGAFTIYAVSDPALGFLYFVAKLRDQVQ